MSTIGFIILRHVNKKEINKYYIKAYECIRKYYPENDIIIIDDNSNPEVLDIETDKTFYKTTIIKSEYPGRGELLPYYYYLNNKLFDIAVILHDSMFINKHIDFQCINYKFLWEFEHNWDQPIDEKRIIEVLDNHEDLMSFYDDKTKWKGCFGAASIIKHDYLLSINEKYNISKLLDVVLTRYNRMSFERVIGCLLMMESNEESLLGNIHKYCKWGIPFQPNIFDLDLPIIKVWSSR